MVAAIRSAGFAFTTTDIDIRRNPSAQQPWISGRLDDLPDEFVTGHPSKSVVSVKEFDIRPANTRNIDLYGDLAWEYSNIFTILHADPLTLEKYRFHIYPFV